MALDADVLIIGAGMSGIGFAHQLKRKNRYATYEIIEKSDNVGGTWWANTYPGCGCDVASHFYSYSFALNPSWTKKFSLQPEIAAYFRSVSDRNNITQHISFFCSVQKAEYDETTAAWEVTIKDERTGALKVRRCKILVSAVGALSVPKKCEIPGADSFQGKMFHSAQWDHSFDWKGKEVVVVGNGCSATQFVPVMSEGTSAVSKLTQFSRQPHWLSKRPNPDYSPLFKWSMAWIPGLLRAYRFYLYYLMESEFAGFNIVTGSKMRENSQETQIRYLKKTAPAKYHDALIPKTEIGCKRKVMDTGYLACLHRPNVELVYSDPIASIVTDGVVTESGRRIQADAIVLATGFETQKVLHPMEIVGEKGVTLQDHWNSFSLGAQSAYYGTMLSSHPNFFILMGPNTATGHLSVIYTIECQINFTLRLISPILSSLHPSKSILSPFIFSVPPTPDDNKNQLDCVTVKPSAEVNDNIWIQSEAQKLVWSTGCTSWYIDEKTSRNTMTYPDWQWKFWLRSVFIPMGDFIYRKTKVDEHMRKKKDVAQKEGVADETSWDISDNMVVVKRGWRSSVWDWNWVLRVGGVVLGMV